jgi:hypothetical protein
MARPRQSGVRYRCGKLKRRQRSQPTLDHGSEYAIDHRAALVGASNVRDPRAGYPLGVARLRGIVTDGQLDAGLRYAALSSLVWGPGRTEASHLGKLVPGDIDDSPTTGDMADLVRWRARKEAELRTAVDAVQALPTARPFHVLENVVVYEYSPRFLDTARRRPASASRADSAEREALTLALVTLAELWGIKSD